MTLVVKILPMSAINRSVVAVAYDGICTFELGVATELFGLARPELDVEWYQFRVVSIDPGPLRAIGGLTMTASTNLRHVRQAGTIVLPGWRNPSELPPKRLLDAICLAHGRGARIVSICSGVFVLAATGLLEGKRATTHWRYTDQLTTMYSNIDVQPDVLYVDNGSTLTSAGSAAGIDLGLHLIRRDYGAAVAATVARRLVVPPHRDGDQAQFISNQVTAPYAFTIAPVIEWVMEHLAEPLSVEDLARHATMSPRTFARRFREEVGVSPHAWLTCQRLSRARELLEATDLSMDDVAEQSGLVTAETLRHHFRRELKTTPTRYRSAFQQSAVM
jgi:AraC family transcriptional regulator, transcriptional activator FtrA